MVPDHDPHKNKAIVLKALDVLFNQRDFEAAAAFWDPRYIQHSALIEPGREGLFDLVRSLPKFKHEAGAATADGDCVMVHSRYTGNERPTALIGVDIFRVQDGILKEHWDVLQDEVTREQSVSGLPMFGGVFPEDR
ncbi:nuclear transport factor 2 family protein [Streptomyces sp. NPDC005794]|uniref:nuclear transport factor 2 family protein n=1 Tax=Streptomyces sp. NPDC005794 TaxID=3364733 RepID=UPI0036D15A7C